MSKKLITGVLISFAIVAGILVGTGFLKILPAQLFHYSTSEEEISVVVLQHRVESMLQYEPIRENEITIIEYWEKERRFGRDTGRVYLFAWISHPSYTVQLRDIDFNMTPNESETLQVQFEDSLIAFQANISDSVEIRRIENPYDANEETQIRSQIQEVLKRHLERKYAESDLRSQAITMTEELLEKLLVSIGGNPVIVRLNII
jgi:hypothetical protein